MPATENVSSLPSRSCGSSRPLHPLSPAGTDTPCAIAIRTVLMDIDFWSEELLRAHVALVLSERFDIIANRRYVVNTEHIDFRDCFQRSNRSTHIRTSMLDRAYKYIQI